MLIKTLTLDEIKKAVEDYACEKYDLLQKPNIKICIDFQPGESVENQMTVTAKIEIED